jgi:hypothetical protein
MPSPAVKGVSRETYSLLYGTHPSLPASLLKEVKKDEERSRLNISAGTVPFSSAALRQFLKRSQVTVKHARNLDTQTLCGTGMFNLLVVFGSTHAIAQRGRTDTCTCVA